MSYRIDGWHARKEANKPLQRNEYDRNHNSSVGQDAFKDNHEIEVEEKTEKLKKENDEYVKRHPTCKAHFYCHDCKKGFIGIASKDHYCACGSNKPAERRHINRGQDTGNGGYANRKG
jgi:hypothetical protein